MTATHYGDPCIHCGIGHDLVPVGPCQGDPCKAVVIAYVSLGVRHDQIEHFVLRMSDGLIKELYAHISYHFTWEHLATRDERLKAHSPYRYVNGRTVRVAA